MGETYERMDNEEYEKYFEHFDPDLYDPRDWARMAAEAGMKYAVITAKHHEGFCLFDSEFTDYKATNTPCGKDLLREWVEAFRAEGLRIGFYYSLLDWHHPEYTIDRNHPISETVDVDEVNESRDMDVYSRYANDQVRELLTNYGKSTSSGSTTAFPEGKHGKGPRRLGLGQSPGNGARAPARHHRQRSSRPPRCGGRMGLPFAGAVQAPRMGHPRRGTSSLGDLPDLLRFVGLLPRRDDLEEPETASTLLIETVSKGGNLLLNVGPTARGTFDDRAPRRGCESIERWTSLHGRSIYGCTAAPPEFPAPESSILTYNEDAQSPLHSHSRLADGEALRRPNQGQNRLCSVSSRCVGGSDRPRLQQPGDGGGSQR